MFKNIRLNLTIRTKLALVSLSIIFISLLLFFIYTFTLSTVSSVRAYVGGEGLWSKSQKDATQHLIRYTITHSEDDYQKFLVDLEVPLGDKIAREELQKSDTDYQKVYAGFIQGKNHPDDVEEMARLFKRFHDVSYLARAIDIWARADAKIIELQQLGSQIHSDTTSGQLTEIKSLAYSSRLDTLNRELTVLENDFSSTMGEASRWLNKVLFWTTATLLAITLFSSIYFSVVVRRYVVGKLFMLRQAATRVAGGDFTRIDDKGSSNDEIGGLITAFNSMVSSMKEDREKLHESYQKSEADKKSLKDTEMAIMNILEDLNEEKTKLQDVSSRNEALLSGIGDGLVATDENGKIILVNKKACELLGLSKGSLLGKKYVQVIPLFGSDKKLIKDEDRMLTRSIKEGITISTDLTNDYYYKRKDKSLLPVAVTVSPVIISGKTTGAITVFRDITREKEVDRAKTEFVSLASHQLRTPLSSINWYSEMLMEGDAGKVNPEQKKYLDEIYLGNKRMTQLVNDLLNVSRVDLGTFSVDPEPIDVVELSKSIIKDLEPRIFERKIGFTETYDPKLTKINLDLKLTRMIIENLASNAVKYSPVEGKVELKIEKLAKSFRISVTDNGYGIPKKQQDSIFSKLFRADNVKARDTEGTGLGLYLVKSIVEYSGGEIWFESVEDKGTTFYVEMPLSGMSVKKGTKKLS